MDLRLAPLSVASDDATAWRNVDDHGAAIMEPASGRDDFAAPVDRVVRRVGFIVRDRRDADGTASVADDARPSTIRRWI